eukprot:NODE_15303_length_1057_cov_6.600000.p1 GENE.NODE_15303_length_1057_cov_6.600000~~NODE_15303_length_1057_cov_6.600000.p1  ORF type:complete len:330 (+),score=102.22 NODE_15303_length_1057_cov_6.600000:117-992(+)
MRKEVSTKLHPEHLPGSGPEQDYLSRFFASAPWHAMDVRWNYQIHHIPFALQHALAYRHSVLAEVPLPPWSNWFPPRLSMNLEDIAIVHFSGLVKLWDLCIDARNSLEDGRSVTYASREPWVETEAFAEHLISKCCESYHRWVARTASPEDYAAFHCVLLSDGGVELRAGDVAEDVTGIVDAAVSQLRGTTRLAAVAWRACAARLLEHVPDLLETFCQPQVAPGSFPPGTRVEVKWQPAGDRPPLWLEGLISSVHADGRHVVRFDRGGSWGDTERGVDVVRIRAAQAAVQC